MEEINNNDNHLRAKLFDLIEEQEKWQRMKDEAMGVDTIDVLRGKIKSIQDKVAHHKDIIERCHKAGKMYLFPQKTEHSWYYNSPEYIPYDERDDWDTEYVIYGGDMYLPELVVSVKHSEKRVSIWQEEITKLEQRVIKFTIAQEQLEQVTQDIADINEQIKNTTTRLSSEELVEDSSSNVENESYPENNKVRRDWIYTDKATSEDKERFKDHIEYLCKNNVSAQIIKDYIKAQEKEDILVPIKPTKQYDLLEEIGVKFKKKTFLNA